MTDRNPYAPSKASLKAPAAIGGDSEKVCRDGKWLVMDIDATLPHRCVKCNEPAVDPLKRVTLSWHHPAIFLLIPLWMLIYLIVALIVRKVLKVEVGLCEEHKRQRRNALMIGLIGMFGIIPLAVVLGLYADQQGAALSFATVGFLGFVIYLMVKTRIVYAKRIDSFEARLGGCGDPFLSSLPPYRS